MSKSISHLLCLLLSISVEAQVPVQLAPPLLAVQSVFFKKELKITLAFAQKGTAIHYTLNGAIPTQTDPVYIQPIRIKKQLTVLTAITAGDGFTPSLPISATLIKDGLAIKSIETTAASKDFPGNGPSTLFDNQGGMLNLHDSGWLGFQTDSVSIHIQLEDRQSIKEVLLHCLQDPGSWIFLPEQVRVYYQDQDGVSHWVATLANPQTAHPPTACVPLLIRFDQKIKSNNLQLLLKGVQSIQAPHPGQGKPGWLFIDEIKLY